MFIVYDVTNRESFENTTLWLKEMERYSDYESKVAIILVGNKCDSDNRIVEEEEARLFAKEKNLFFFETSAKTSVGVTEAFENPVDKILDKIFGDKEKKELSEKKTEKQNCNLF